MGLSSALAFPSSLRTAVLAQAVFAVLLAGASLGCNEAPLIAAPDARAPCQKPQPIYPCVVHDAGTEGCSPDLQSSISLGQEVVLSTGSYPAGCDVQVNATVLDQDNQCIQLGTCSCGDDGGAYGWTCFASH